MHFRTMRTASALLPLLLTTRLQVVHHVLELRKQFLRLVAIA